MKKIKDKIKLRLKKKNVQLIFYFMPSFPHFQFPLNFKLLYNENVLPPQYPIFHILKNKIK
jgi:hypothetical protein